MPDILNKNQFNKQLRKKKSEIPASIAGFKRNLSACKLTEEFHHVDVTTRDYNQKWYLEQILKKPQWKIHIVE